MSAHGNFIGKADVYAKYRPNYPQEYIADLLSANELNSSRKCGLELLVCF